MRFPIKVSSKESPPVTTEAHSTSSTSSNTDPLPSRRFYVAHKWRHPRALIALLVLETPLTIATLALFGIASPNLYRTKLWADGYANGYNSSPNQVLYDFANHRTPVTPLCWSSFVTEWNLVISVLSMFILLAKTAAHVMNVFWPLISLFVGAVEVALYAVSLHAQTAKDLSDPAHLQRGPPWYITKSCSVVHEVSNLGYCRQAKASFAVTICMVYVTLSHPLPLLHH